MAVTRDSRLRTASRRVRESQQPLSPPRDQRANTEAALAQQLNANRVEEEDDGPQAFEVASDEGEDEDSAPEGSQEDDIRPECDAIDIDYELKAIGTVTGDLKGKGVTIIGATMLPMKGFTRPYNDIDEDVVREEHDELYRTARAWAYAHVLLPGIGADSETRLAYRAEITSGGRKTPQYIDLNVINHEGLVKVYECVRRMAHSNTRKDIRCEVIYYTKLEKTVSQANEAASQPQPSQNNRKRARAATTEPARRETAIERRERDEGETREGNQATGNHIGELKKEWKCRNQACSNYSYICLKVAGMGRCIPLGTQDLKRWAKAIRDKRGSVTECPTSLRQEWVLRQQELTMNATARSAEKKPILNGLFEGMPSPLVVVQNSNPLGYNGRSQQPTFDNIRSSPPLLEFGTPIENLEEFLQWLEREGKVAARFVAAAREGLEEEGHTWETLKAVSDAEWKGMGVKMGPMIAIRKGMKVFATEYLRKKLNEGRRNSPMTISDEEVTPIADNGVAN
jgi:hypothetical protein